MFYLINYIMLRWYCNTATVFFINSGGSIMKLFHSWIIQGQTIRKKKAKILFHLEISLGMHAATSFYNFNSNLLIAQILYAQQLKISSASVSILQLKVCCIVIHFCLLHLASKHGASMVIRECILEIIDLNSSISVLPIIIDFTKC